MTTLQERRHAVIIAQVAREGEYRDKAIARLIRSDEKLRKLRRQLARLEKRAAVATPAPANAPAPATPPPVQEPVKVKPLPPAILDEARRTADVIDESIPTFLRRTAEAEKEGRAKDAAALAAIQAEQAAARKTKSQVREQKKKARQRGDTRKMPLSGRDALAAIRQG